MVLSDTEDDIEPQSMYKETKSRIKRSCSTPIQVDSVFYFVAMIVHKKSLYFESGNT